MDGNDKNDIKISKIEQAEIQQSLVTYCRSLEAPFQVQIINERVKKEGLYSADGISKPDLFNYFMSLY
jgi:hypothetical protein